MRCLLRYILSPSKTQSSGKGKSVPICYIGVTVMHRYMLTIYRSVGTVWRHRREELPRVVTIFSGMHVESRSILKSGFLMLGLKCNGNVQEALQP